MTSITPNDGESALPWVLDVCPATLPSSTTINSFKCPNFTNCSKWSLNTLHFLVVCPFSQWYMQYKFWFLLARSPPVLLSHQKYGSFLICSRILWTGSLKATLISPSRTLSSWILSSLLGLDWKPPVYELFAYCEMASALPFFCCQSSSNLLYSSIHLINWCILLRGLMFKESHNFKSYGSPNLKVLAATFSLPPPISLYSSQYRLA